MSYNFIELTDQTCLSFIVHHYDVFVLSLYM